MIRSAIIFAVFFTASLLLQAGVVPRARCPRCNFWLFSSSSIPLLLKNTIVKHKEIIVSFYRNAMLDLNCAGELCFCFLCSMQAGFNVAGIDLIRR